jgi:hypothetical protein
MYNTVLFYNTGTGTVQPEQLQQKYTYGQLIEPELMLTMLLQVSSRRNDVFLTHLSHRILDGSIQIGSVYWWRYAQAQHICQGSLLNELPQRRRPLLISQQ